MFTRHPNNPLIKPRDVKPSRSDFEVIGAFNAGATTYNGELLLLLRVAERPIRSENTIIPCPYLDDHGDLVLKQVRSDDPNYNTRDSRLIVDKRSGEVWLTSLSHLRLARSVDGVHFAIDERPWLQGEPPYETFGMEDARISRIEGKYFVNYTAVSPNGIATALASTRDFVQIERHGLIFAPQNRDVTIFSKKIGGQYICYHRPMPSGLGRLNIWLATSPDLIHWGELSIVLDSRVAGRTGGGAPPIRTEQGWLSIYHAADANQRYTLGAFLTPLDQPGRIIARSREPIFAPEQPYETSGFFGNVVFTCGAIAEGDKLRLYYGASDETTALAEASLSEVIRSLQP